MDIDLTLMNDPTLPPVVMPACPIEKKLMGQKALVTGASSGIGKGIAIGLGHAGADVVVNYVSGPADAEAVVDEPAEALGEELAIVCSRARPGRFPGNVDGAGDQQLAAVATSRLTGRRVVRTCNNCYPPTCGGGENFIAPAAVF